MYQISPRKPGKCVLCPEETQVVSLNKDGQTLQLCKKHLWEALKPPSSRAEQVQQPTTQVK